MKTQMSIAVEPTLAEYLAARLRNDDELLVERQNALGKDENATWQYLQGKRDMCKQFALYLEEIQRAPKVVIEQPSGKSEQPGRNAPSESRLFHYPDDYDRNE